MTFIAHWKIGGEPGSAMNGQAAVDSAAGGSGAHNGIYRVNTSESIAPHGYDENLSLRCAFSNNDGIIDSFGNISDLQITGTYSVMFWFTPTTWLSNRMYVINIGASGSTEATNNLIWIGARSSGHMRAYWEHGAGTGVIVDSTDPIITTLKWHHIAVVRYPISANYGVKFYVNGTLEDTQDNGGGGYTAASGGTSTVGYIGRSAEDSYSADYYKLDSIRVYDSDESSNVSSIYDTEKSYFGEGFPVVQMNNPLTATSREVLINEFARTGPKLLLEGNTNAGFHR